MKKYLLALAVVLWMLSVACFADTITVTLNENKINCLEYGQEPIIENGRTLVPLRAIFEALGAEVEWNNQEKSVLSTKDKTSIYLKINDDKLIKNGKEIKLDVPAKIEHGRTLVPVRAVAEAFDVEVHWNSDTRTVELFDIKTAVFSKGRIQENSFKNQYLCIDFTLPEGFAFWSDVQIKSALDYVRENGNELDIDTELDKYEFVASDKSGNNIQITSNKYSTDALMDIEGIKQMYPDLKCSENYNFYVCGQKYVFFDVEYDDVTQTFGTCVRGERMVNLVFTYKIKHDFQKMLSGFQN